MRGAVKRRDGVDEDCREGYREEWMIDLTVPDHRHHPIRLET